MRRQAWFLLGRHVGRSILLLRASPATRLGDPRHPSFGGMVTHTQCQPRPTPTCRFAGISATADRNPAHVNRSPWAVEKSARSNREEFPPAGENSPPGRRATGSIRIVAAGTRRVTLAVESRETASGLLPCVASASHCQEAASDDSGRNLERADRPECPVRRTGDLAGACRVVGRRVRQSKLRLRRPRRSPGCQFQRSQRKHEESSSARAVLESP